MRAIHVIAGLDPAHGGPSYSVPALCRALADAGAELSLLSVGPSHDQQADAGQTGYSDRRFSCDHTRIPVWRGLRSSSGLSAALRGLAPRADVIHNHGLWLLPNLQAGWRAAAASKPLVVSPRGMLSPAALRFSRLKKKAVWGLAQGAVLRRAACLHATSDQEGEEIRAAGLNNPIAVIPNGIDVPLSLPDLPEDPTADRTVLSLGRLHPKKGLDRLLRAWATIEVRHPAWRLMIAGPSESGHADELNALAGALGLARVTIDGPVFGEAKWRTYRSADLFVLPTLNENFGLTVAESLAAETPAICTSGAPWSGLDREGCGWWIEQGIEPLAAALDSAMSMPAAQLRDMGARGRAWIAREFSWERAATEMLAVYRWIAGVASTPPDTVRLA